MQENRVEKLFGPHIREEGSRNERRLGYTVRQKRGKREKKRGGSKGSLRKKKVLSTYKFQ